MMASNDSPLKVTTACPAVPLLKTSTFSLYGIGVEGANLISKHTKPNAANPQGGIIKQEAKIHISNLMLVDPKSGDLVKVGRKRDDKTGKLVRIAKKTGEVIK